MAVFGGIWRYLAVFGGIWRYLAVLGGIGRYWAVLGGIGRYWAVLGGIGRYWAVYAVPTVITRLLYPVCKAVFGEWNLSVNDSKTERLHFYQAIPRPQNRKKMVPGIEYRGDEAWRKHKVLGSILCSNEDIKKKCILGNVAYANFKNVWSRNDISLDRRLKIYDAQVVSIMLYNAIAGLLLTMHLTI